jgi:hypothetical protein
MAADAYAESGEFIDVLSQEYWQVLRGPVTAELRQARPDRGPIVDIGAGTGLGTLVAAAAVPEADIIAVEPSPILRAVLLSRLVADEDLRRRVTVQASDAQRMALPDRVGGVLALNMIGHLSAPERRKLWTDLRPRLAPSAPLVVNLQPPAEVTTVAETEFTSVPIGRRIYQGSGGASPAGDDAVTWTMRYRVLDEDGRVERQTVVRYLWHVVSPECLREELTDAGYLVERPTADMVVATCQL